MVFMDTEACGGGTFDLSTPLGFLEYLGIYRANRQCRGLHGGHNPQGASGLLGAPWWVVLPTGLPSGTSLAHWVSSGPEKSPIFVAAFGLHLVLIFCEVKNKQKTATGTRHYVNRLVQKMI